MGLMIKGLGQRIPLFELAFWRSALGLAPLAVLLARGRISFTSAQWRTLAMRGIWGLIAMLCYFRAIGVIPLADAVLLNYTSPLFAAVFAVFALGERPSPRTVAILMVALAGIVAVCKPTFQGAPWDYMIALGAGAFSGAAYVTVKLLTRFEPALRIVWYFNLVSCVGVLPLAVAQWQWPSWQDGLWLAAIATTGTAGQVLMTFGFQHAPVARATVPTLGVLAVSAAGAWLFWGETPDTWSWVGILAILTASAAVSMAPSRHLPAQPCAGTR